MILNRVLRFGLLPLNHELKQINKTSRVILRAFSISSKRMADVEVKVENGIRTITMNRPNKLNAITDQMYRAMGISMLESNKDDLTKIVVITGAGNKSFTSGYDLKSLVEDCNNKVPPPENGASSFIRALIECRKPLVALVNGNAVGIGVTLLAHCEAVYATDKATFTTPFIRLGIPPECCSSYLFPKVVGHVKAGELLHFNEPWTAQDAFQNGLVTKIFPEEQFQAKAWERVQQMAEYPLQSLLNSKELIRGQERELLRKVHEAENELFNTDVIGPSAKNLLDSRKK